MFTQAGLETAWLIPHVKRVTAVYYTGLLLPIRPFDSHLLFLQ